MQILMFFRSLFYTLCIHISIQWKLYKLIKKLNNLNFLWQCKNDDRDEIYREKNNDHNIFNINVFKLHTLFLRTFKILVGNCFKFSPSHTIVQAWTELWRRNTQCYTINDWVLSFYVRALFYHGTIVAAGWKQIV